MSPYYYLRTQAIDTSRHDTPPQFVLHHPFRVTFRSSTRKVRHQDPQSERMVVPVTSSLIPADPVDDETWAAIIDSQADEKVPAWLAEEPDPLDP